MTRHQATAAVASFFVISTHGGNTTRTAISRTKVVVVRTAHSSAKRQLLSGPGAAPLAASREGPRSRKRRAGRSPSGHTGLAGRAPLAYTIIMVKFPPGGGRARSRGV